jgi:hypothetical protein
MGVRQVTFGTLRAGEAFAVLKTKIPPSMKIYEGDGENNCPGGEEPRIAVIRQVTGYLYGPQPKQAIAEARLGNSERRPLNRSDVVTPAVLEEAVSYGIDRSLDKSLSAGKLVGLDAADIIGFLHRHFVGLARTLRPHNVADHATEWFERDRPTIVDIVPLATEIKNSPYMLEGVRA